MSGIFDLFGGTGNAARSQSLSGPTDIAKRSATNTTMFSGGGMSAKNAGLSRVKPRGLSIRSVNDLNISNLNIKSCKSPTRKSPIKDLLKPGQFDGALQQRSPAKKTKALKMQIIKSKQLKAMSSKTKSPDSDSICEKKQAAENLMKKPMTPKYSNRKTKVYPEPETLGLCYDFEKELNDFALDTDFLAFPRRVKPYEDEGFESDPEEARSSPPPILSTVRVYLAPLDDEIQLSSPELPSLSDDDDFLD